MQRRMHVHASDRRRPQRTACQAARRGALERRTRGALERRTSVPLRDALERRTRMEAADTRAQPWRFAPRRKGPDIGSGAMKARAV